MKDKTSGHAGVQDLCRKLKEQLDQLTDTVVDEAASTEEKNRRKDLMERLKAQLTELSL